MVELRISPSLGFKIIDKEIVELQHKIPPSEDDHFVFLGQQGSDMSSSRLWGGSFRLKLFPFESIQFQLIEIVERCSLVINASMSSENHYLILVVSHRMIGSWLWPSDFGHGIFGWSD